MQNNNQAAKADNGKPKLSLVPAEIINCIARVREFGCEKYHDPDNWKNVEKERYIDAAYRHWIKYVDDNNSIDEESGLPHLYHCCCNLAFLCEFDKVEREARETRRAILKVEAEEHKSSKKISAPPSIIKDAIQGCKHYVPHVLLEPNIKNCRNCQYFNGKECTSFPNEHKECENKWRLL